MGLRRIVDVLFSPPLLMLLLIGFMMPSMYRSGAGDDDYTDNNKWACVNFVKKMCEKKRTKRNIVCKAIKKKVNIYKREYSHRPVKNNMHTTHTHTHSAQYSRHALWTKLTMQRPKEPKKTLKPVDVDYGVCIFVFYSFFFCLFENF